MPLSRLLVYTFLVVAAGACGHKPSLNIQGFEKEVAAFEYEAGLRGQHIRITDLSIDLKPGLDRETGKSGRCLVDYARFPGLFDTRGTPRVELDADNWNDATDDQREALVFHELGHCILDKRHHYEVPGVNWVPIMHPDIFALRYDFYQSNRDAMLDHLFAR